MQPYSVPLSSHNFEAGLFLNPDRPETQWISCTSEVNDIVEQAFEKVTGQSLQGISILVCPFDQFKSIHSEFGPWSEGIMGFSINK
ncbi:hypothetical protein KY329_04040, partial [Candidatus Woesearchaeota archaeon]|nr:hypothetical protein [Candidatus Woesearchaeota archaeon]